MSDPKTGGVPSPNYTQIPNLLFDEILPHMKSLSELKVILAVARKTFGFHKRADLLSLTQIEELTGLSRQGVLDGVKAGLERGILQRKPRGGSFIYGLKISEKTAEEVVNNLDQSKVLTSQQFRPELVNNLDQQGRFASQQFRPTKERVLKESIKESTYVQNDEISSRKKVEKAPAAKTSKPAPADLEKIYAAYPRRVGKPKAIQAIETALKRIRAGDDKPEDAESWPPLSPEVWLHDRAATFARSDKGNAGDFTPHPSTWFNQSRYSDNPAEWSAKDNSHEQPKYTAREQAAQRSREVDAELDEYIAAALTANGLLPDSGAACNGGMDRSFETAKEVVSA